MDYMKEYMIWLDRADEKTKAELDEIKNDRKEIEERFYKNLEFGTGGLRGIIRAGTNGVNIYTISKATQGLANYINTLKLENPSVAVSFDSRKYSPEFAMESAKVLAANKIKSYIFSELKPVPELSFAVRELKCTAGIMITASHNPKKYNGYKVYWSDGGQLPPESADKVLEEMNGINDVFGQIKTISESDAKSKGLIEIISDEIEEKYLEKVLDQTVIKDAIKNAGNEFKVVYTPFHGSGNIPVRKALKKAGFNNLIVVPEQEKPDPEFSTVKSPNPEEKDGFKLAIELARKNDVDLIFGTDPDCDRVGVVVKDKKGEYKVLTGNQTGVLLVDYILSNKKLPENPLIIKTIVTSEMARAICDDKNVAIMDVLTGFKFIGEKIKQFEKTNEYNYVFGFEESYGYLAGTHARDKDAVVASMLIVEMGCFYKNLGMSLDDAMEKLYNKYGYYIEDLISIVIEGKSGQERINEIMSKLRENTPDLIGNLKVLYLRDYNESVRINMTTKEKEVIDLPSSNVLYFELEDGSYFVVRPSGTEPKIKLYFATKSNSKETSIDSINFLKDEVGNIIKKI